MTQRVTLPHQLSQEKVDLVLPKAFPLRLWQGPSAARTVCLALSQPQLQSAPVSKRGCIYGDWWWSNREGRFLRLSLRSCRAWPLAFGVLV